MSIDVIYIYYKTRAMDAQNETKQFLKVYSSVENSFIDDFFGQVDINSPDDGHTVDCDLVAKWLRVRKSTILKTLKASYTLNVDYVIRKRPYQPGRGKNTYRQVLLTPDCFKTLCMQSKSHQSEKVRAYFIAVEKTLLRYRAEIMKAMHKRIEQLENNQRPLKNSLKNTGVVYVVTADDNITVSKLGRTKDLVQRVKLGYTSNLGKRLQSHGSALADKLKLLYVYKTDNMIDVEACAKGVLRGTQYRKFKEVYEANMDLVKKTIQGCGSLVNKVQQPISQQKGGTLARVFMIFSRDD